MARTHLGLHEFVVDNVRGVGASAHGEEDFTLARGEVGKQHLLLRVGRARGQRHALVEGQLQDGRHALRLGNAEHLLGDGERGSLVLLLLLGLLRFYLFGSELVGLLVFLLLLLARVFGFEHLVDA